MQIASNKATANSSPGVAPTQGVSPSSSFQGLKLPPVDPDMKNAIRAFASVAGAGVGAFVGSKLGPDLVQGMLQSLDVPAPLAGMIAQHSQPFTAGLGAAVGAQMANDLVDRIF